MCQSMVDIQPAAAEIRRGNKKEDRKKETTGQKYNGPLLHRAAIKKKQDKNIMSASATQDDHNDDDDEFVKSDNNTLTHAIDPARHLTNLTGFLRTVSQFLVPHRRFAWKCHSHILQRSSISTFEQLTMRRRVRGKRVART